MHIDDLLIASLSVKEHMQGVHSPSTTMLSDYGIMIHHKKYTL